MSRIGKLPIPLPAGVQVSVDKENTVTVKGPKGTLTQVVDRDISVALEGGDVVVTRPTEQKRHKAMHGLYRSLINNMITGVNTGFEHKLELVGVGYKATLAGSALELSLGYSHNVYLALPKEVSATAVTEKGKNPIVTLTSIDKQLDWSGSRQNPLAAESRALQRQRGALSWVRVVRRKAGKTAAKK